MISNIKKGGEIHHSVLLSVMFQVNHFTTAAIQLRRKTLFSAQSRINVTDAGSMSITLSMIRSPD